jgi:hypothetical protein
MVISRSHVPPGSRKRAKYLTHQDTAEHIATGGFNRNSYFLLRNYVLEGRNHQILPLAGHLPALKRPVQAGAGSRATRW